MNKIIILTIIVSLLVVGCKGVQTMEKTMPKAIFETNMGTFVVELETNKAPITTGNFIELAENNFYNGVKFHRVIKNFMIQSGDPLSKDDAQQARWGTGGPGYKIDDEFNPDLKNYEYTISMANAGPNTGGSQFFINVANNNFLDNKHAVFGKVIEGKEVVDKISVIKTTGSPYDRPLEPVIINKITIEKN